MSNIFTDKFVVDLFYILLQSRLYNITSCVRIFIDEAKPKMHSLEKSQLSYIDKLYNKELV